MTSSSAAHVADADDERLAKRSKRFAETQPAVVGLPSFGSGSGCAPASGSGSPPGTACRQQQISRVAHPGGPIATNKAAALARFLKRKLESPGGLASLDPALVEKAVLNAKAAVRADLDPVLGLKVRHVASFLSSEDESGSEESGRPLPCGNDEATKKKSKVVRRERKGKKERRKNKLRASGDTEHFDRKEEEHRTTEKKRGGAGREAGVEEKKTTTKKKKRLFLEEEQEVGKKTKKKKKRLFLEEEQEVGKKTRKKLKQKDEGEKDAKRSKRVTSFEKRPKRTESLRKKKDKKVEIRKKRTAGGILQRETKSGSLRELGK